MVCEKFEKVTEQLKTDVTRVAKSLTLTAEWGVGFKVKGQVGNLEGHAGATLHAEKTIPIRMEHQSGEIITGEKPLAIKAEADIGGGVGHVKASVEPNIKADEDGVEGKVDKQLSFGPGSVDGERLSVGGAVYDVVGGGLTLSVDQKAAGKLLTDVISTARQLLPGNN